MRQLSSKLRKNKELQILKDDDEYDDFLNTKQVARAQTNVILAGKCDSNRHSTTSLSEYVVMAKPSYQMLGILSFGDREKIGNKRANFGGEKSTMNLSGVSILKNRLKT